MNIVHIASEMTTIAKAGGLADVVEGLNKELAKENINISVILPLYQFIEKENLKKEKDFFSYFDGKKMKNSLFSSIFNEIKIFFIEPQENNYFSRKRIYGYNDDIERFTYFSRSAFDLLNEEDLSVDLIHLHDWHTSVIAPLYKSGKQKKDSPVVLTIHNTQYQGICRSFDLDRIGLDSKFFFDDEKMKDSSLFKKNFNLLKGGIVYSDAVTVVSPTYAKEILSKKQGHGLEAVYNKHIYKIKGILNGIDTTMWNPESDPHLIQNYSFSDPIELILEAKKKNKHFLQEKLGLKTGNKPLIVNIGRLAYQKGPKLLYDAVIFTKKEHYQFVLVTSFSEKKLSKKFIKLKKQMKDSEDVSFYFHFDEELAHLVYAAADFILIPSIFEPCGLTQLIAFQYGTIPIVRNTGGLSDTVFDIDHSYRVQKTGYVFENYSKKEQRAAIQRALKNQTTDKHVHLIQTVMQVDYNWSRSAKEYIKIYQNLIFH